MIEKDDASAFTVKLVPSGAFRKPVLVFLRKTDSGGFSQQECSEIYDRTQAIAPVVAHWNGSPEMTYSVCVEVDALAMLVEFAGGSPQ